MIYQRYSLSYFNFKILNILKKGQIYKFWQMTINKGQLKAIILAYSLDDKFIYQNLLFI